VLVLTRGEPTSIEVVNRTTERTAVHWHGIELESYYDGVVGFGGTPGVRTTRAIRPGRTFEVRLTPKRAGTFMYHTHFDELRQTYGGLAGVIVVLEPGERWDPERDRVFAITDPSSLPPRRYYINGSLAPPPQDLRVGTTYRFRIANPSADAPTVRFRITADSAPIGVARPMAGDALPWRQVAKDGWPLANALASVGPSGQRVASGETADFELTPDRPGDFRLEAFVVDPVRRTMTVTAAVVLRVSAASR